MSRLLYLYGFVPRSGTSPPAELRGVGASTVDLVDLGDVAAAVSAVPSEAFSPAVVEERVHDLAWIGEQGALHERVVTWFVDHGGILPARLLTLYSGEPALRDAMQGRTTDVADRLTRLKGLREWDLKVSFDAERLVPHLGEFSDEVARLDRELAAATPGRRYLLERKRDELVRTEISRAARGLAEEVLEALSPLATELKRLPLPREHGELPVVLGAALLLPANAEPEAEERSAAVRARLAPHGVDVLFTGPWAPYRFLEGDGERVDRRDDVPE